MLLPPAPQAQCLVFLNPRNPAELLQDQCSLASTHRSSACPFPLWAEQDSVRAHRLLSASQVSPFGHSGKDTHNVTTRLHVLWRTWGLTHPWSEQPWLHSLSTGTFSVDQDDWEEPTFHHDPASLPFKLTHVQQVLTSTRENRQQREQTISALFLTTLHFKRFLFCFVLFFAANKISASSEKLSTLTLTVHKTQSHLPRPKWQKPPRHSEPTSWLSLWTVLYWNTAVCFRTNLQTSAWAVLHPTYCLGPSESLSSQTHQGVKAVRRLMCCSTFNQQILVHELEIKWHKAGASQLTHRVTRKRPQGLTDNRVGFPIYIPNCIQAVSAWWKPGLLDISFKSPRFLAPYSDQPQPWPCQSQGPRPCSPRARLESSVTQGTWLPRMVFLLLSLFTEGMPTPIYGVSSTAPNHNGGAFSLKQGGEGQGQQAPRFQQFYLLSCHLKVTKNIHTHIYVCMCIYSEAIKHFSLMELILVNVPMAK